MEERSWSSNLGGAIEEEKSWRRTHVEGVVEGIWRQGLPGGTQEVFRRHPAGTQEVPRTSPGGTQEVPRASQRRPEAPRGHPESAQRHPGSSQGAILKPLNFNLKNNASAHFRVDGSDATLTVPTACAQKLANVNADLCGEHFTHSQDTPPEPLQLKTAWGTFYGKSLP